MKTQADTTTSLQPVSPILCLCKKTYLQATAVIANQLGWLSEIQTIQITTSEHIIITSERGETVYFSTKTIRKYKHMTKNKN